MSSPLATAPARPGLIRVVVYYVVAGIATALLVRFVPIVAEALGGNATGGAADLAADGVFGPGSAPPLGEPILGMTPGRQAVLASISMLGALALMVPVTWVYMLTRRQRGFDESVVHTLLILPVAVTGIVMVVQSDVALAFSLAGIVAAVRFRTTLDDTKDAVYVFLAIGVGLASGVQSVGVAVALSLVFNVLVLVLWRTRFGDVDADDRGSAAVGVAGLGAAASGLAGGGLSPNLERMILDERAKPKEKRPNSLLLVQASSAEKGQAYVDGVLDEKAARWKLVEVAPGPNGARLAYLARLEGDGTQGAVMDRLGAGAGGVVVGAEMRSLKGIKPTE